jgi:hypothetical protein
MHSADADQRKYGEAVAQLQAAWCDMLTRSNPAQAADLAAANRSWAQMQRINRAASYLGADEGAFTPAQLASASKALSTVPQFSAGGALMQPYAEAGKTALQFGDSRPSVPTRKRRLEGDAS